jgi:hypothetical protein
MIIWQIAQNRQRVYASEAGLQSCSVFLKKAEKRRKILHIHTLPGRRTGCPGQKVWQKRFVFCPCEWFGVL